MKTFIIVSDEKPYKNHLGKTTGKTEKRAIMYSPKVGAHRLYREGFDQDGKNGWKFKKYRSAKAAQEDCDHINKAYHDDFYVIEYAN